MDISNIPNDFQWLVPIISKLNRQLETDEDISISETEEKTFKSRFSIQIRNELENWIDQDSPESDAFLTALPLLDGLGLLQETEPRFDYAFWVSELNSPNWGNRAGAAQEIGDNWLERLSKKELKQLVESINDSGRVFENPNTKIWLSWLLCKIGVSIESNLANIEQFLDEKTIMQNSFDVVTDACFAILKLDDVPSSSYRRIQNIVCSELLSPCANASVFDVYLRSVHVPVSQKLEAYEAVSTSNASKNHEDLEDVLNEFSNLKNS